MTGNTPAGPASTPEPLWRNVSFTLMWISTAASGFGDRLVQLATYPLLGIGQHDASSVQASVTFFFMLPWLVFGPLGGYLADRLPRKWLLMACEEGRAAVLLTAVLTLRAYAPDYQGTSIPDNHPLAHFAYTATYGVVAAIGAISAMFAPTRDATTPQIVPLGQLQSANAIVLAIATIASLLGLEAGGWIIKEYSVLHAVACGFAAYFITGFFWPFLRIHQTDKPADLKPSSHSMAQAGRFILSHRRLKELVLLNVMFWCLASVVFASVGALCAKRFNLPAEELVPAMAKMQATLGAGMLLSSILLARFSTMRESHWMAMGALAGCGIALVPLWLSPWYGASLLAAFVVGFLSNIARVGVDTLTQANAPNYLRGRILGLREILSTIAIAGTNLIIWKMPKADNLLVSSMPVLAGLLVVVGGYGFWREIRKGPQPSASLNILWRVDRLIVFAWHQLRVVGKSNVPSKGSVILASNHTTGLDPFLIQAGLPRMVRWVMYKPYRFAAANFMWDRINPICLELDGGNDLGSIRQIIRELQQDALVGLFPEGGIQREVRELKPFEPGIGFMTKKSNAAIVPVWIAGTPRRHHMFWQMVQPSRCIVIFGKPYRPEKTLGHEQVAEDLRRRMLELAQTAKAMGYD